MAFQVSVDIFRLRGWVGCIPGWHIRRLFEDTSGRSDFMESMETSAVQFRTFQHVRWNRIEIHDAVTPATWKS